MKVLRVFFIGLVYGWFMRWIVDKIFMDENLRIMTNENALLKQRIRTLESAQSSGAIRVRQTTPDALPVEELERPGSSAAGLGVSPHRDDLKLIKGVGPILEKKLNDAGVYNFEQMSRLTAGELQAILGVARRNDQNTENLISQARKFAQDGPKG